MIAINRNQIAISLDSSANTIYKKFPVLSHGSIMMTPKTMNQIQGGSSPTIAMNIPQIIFSTVYNDIFNRKTPPEAGLNKFKLKDKREACKNSKSNRFPKWCGR